MTRWLVYLILGFGGALTAQSASSVPWLPVRTETRWLPKEITIEDIQTVIQEPEHFLTELPLPKGAAPAFVSKTGKKRRLSAQVKLPGVERNYSLIADINNHAIMGREGQKGLHLILDLESACTDLGAQASRPEEKYCAVTPCFASSCAQLARRVGKIELKIMPEMASRGVRLTVSAVAFRGPLPADSPSEEVANNGLLKVIGLPIFNALDPVYKSLEKAVREQANLRENLNNMIEGQDVEAPDCSGL